ncbi:hypothetical protein DFH09DRAFT_1084491 [Mycena vulgaris]|nr:hypothetical protein DFH09DRAFT_1084491 [Mycena vulgaris]
MPDAFDEIQHKINQTLPTLIPENTDATSAISLAAVNGARSDVVIEGRGKPEGRKLEEESMNGATKDTGRYKRQGRLVGDPDLTRMSLDVFENPDKNRRRNVFDEPYLNGSFGLVRPRPFNIPSKCRRVPEDPVIGLMVRAYPCDKTSRGESEFCDCGMFKSEEAQVLEGVCSVVIWRGRIEAGARNRERREWALSCELLLEIFQAGLELVASSTELVIIVGWHGPIYLRPSKLEACHGRFRDHRMWSSSVTPAKEMKMEGRGRNGLPTNMHVVRIYSNKHCARTFRILTLSPPKWSARISTQPCSSAGFRYFPLYPNFPAHDRFRSDTLISLRRIKMPVKNYYLLDEAYVAVFGIFWDVYVSEHAPVLPTHPAGSVTDHFTRSAAAVGYSSVHIEDSILVGCPPSPQHTI